MDHILAIMNGDEAAFQEVFNGYHEKLYFYVFTKTRSAYLAEEVVQLSFIKLWKYRKSLNPSLAFSTQLYRIATTTLIDLRRKQSLSQDLTDSLEKTDIPSGEDFFANNSAKEMQAQLHTAMQNLPPVRRKVFEMSRIEGLTYKEIAQRLSISTKTVEHHISKALKAIRIYFPILTLIFLCGNLIFR
ncbi:RNA polymerase sigma factor [Pinibacter aurantiacus]|uniref:RNA polymerase sigma-70 factor n=1 Tax=Pinibacter aurantiacus TaxID=2851599 RepID=A0A9E2SFI8_9BACT|nr:RNA polymerase sigma-70 factor [Pinibacter aurantiacus]MBV4360568.1 RNA polymerase sigma-70 factor [Pinibacter aurantiacus]